MKNEQLYLETIDIILDAYNEKKLNHLDPCGCFVGNIVAVRYKDLKPAVFTETVLHLGKDYSYSPDWYNQGVILYRNPHNVVTAWEPVCSPEEAKKQIEATGYTVAQVSRMEEAFERASLEEQGDSQLEGMKAALKVLAEIHETMPDESLERLQVIHEKVYV